MGIIIKESLKASVVSYLGVFLGAFNSLYLFPKIIGSEGIGIISIISAAASLFLPLLQFGFNISLIKFFPVFKDKPYFGTFLTYAFLIPIFALVIFVFLWPFINSLFDWLFHQNAHIIFDNIEWVLPLSGTLMLFGLLESYSKAKFKIVFPAVVRNLVWRVSMTIGVLLIGLDYLNFNLLANVLAGSWILCLVIMVFYVISLGSFKLGFNKLFFQSSDFKPLNLFSGYVILVSLGGVLVQRIDQLMVASYLGTSAAGVFSTAMYFATLIEIPKRSVISIIQPVLVESFKNNELKKVGDLYKKSSLNLFIIGSIIFLLIWVNVRDIFELIPRSEEFLSGIFVVFFYCLAKIIDMGMGCNNEIIVYSKYYKINLPLQFFLIGVVILTNAIFIPRFNIAGAALATCVSVFVYNLLRFWYLYYKMGLQPFTKQSLKFLVLISFFFILGSVIPFRLTPIFNIVLRSFVLIVPLIFVFYYLKISEVINEYVNNSIQKLKNKF